VRLGSQRLTKIKGRIMVQTSSIKKEKDNVLVSLIREGNKKAFNVIYERYHKQLYFIALSYFKDPGMREDVVQETFIKLWTFRDNLKEELSLKSFLITCLRNRSLNVIRNNKTKRKHLQLLQCVDSKRNDVEDKVLLGEYQQILEKGVCQLSPAKQHIFRLRMQGMNNIEISEDLSLSINTIKFQYSQGSKFMRRYLHDNAGIL
jgi:RNA polymerase sigma-70 factor (ECF subfamily)